MVLSERKLFEIERLSEMFVGKLGYYLLGCRCKNEDGEYSCFGAKITLHADDCFEDESVEDIAFDESDAADFVKQMYLGGVTPVHLPYMAEDYVIERLMLQ